MCARRVGACAGVADTRLQVVWPYSSGEVSVQNYNALLSLAHACGVADGIVVSFNDVAHRACAPMAGGAERVTFDDMNVWIATGVASLLLPSRCAFA